MTSSQVGHQNPVGAPSIAPSSSSGETESLIDNVIEEVRQNHPTPEQRTLAEIAVPAEPRRDNQLRKSIRKRLLLNYTVDGTKLEEWRECLKLAKAKHRPNQERVQELRKELIRAREEVEETVVLVRRCRKTCSSICDYCITDKGLH